MLLHPNLVETGTRHSRHSCTLCSPAQCPENRHTLRPSMCARPECPRRPADAPESEPAFHAQAFRCASEHFRLREVGNEIQLLPFVNDRIAAAGGAHAGFIERQPFAIFEEVPPAGIPKEVSEIPPREVVITIGPPSRTSTLMSDGLYGGAFGCCAVFVQDTTKSVRTQKNEKGEQSRKADATPCAMHALSPGLEFIDRKKTQAFVTIQQSAMPVETNAICPSVLPSISAGSQHEGIVIS